MSKELPILFNADMVQAILEGRKTVTRRVIKPRQLTGLGCDRCPNNLPQEYIKEKKLLFSPYCHMSDKELINAIYKPPYQPGSILYVRETWYKVMGRYMYRANYAENEKFYQDGKKILIKWKPSIHMPKAAARIWLKVTDVRVERLQDINGLDVLKEGINSRVHPKADYFDMNQRDMFERLWNSTIKKADLPLYGWDANPWVWVIEFERCEKPERSNCL